MQCQVDELGIRVMTFMSKHYIKLLRYPFCTFCVKTFYLQNDSKYGTHHSYVLVVHTLRVAENEILKLDLSAKRH
jgi:hypothetical protein